MRKIFSPRFVSTTFGLLAMASRGSGCNSPDQFEFEPRAVEAVAEEDGFEIADSTNTFRVYENGESLGQEHGNLKLFLDLGSCTLRVHAQVKVSEDDKLTDIYDYRFDGQDYFGTSGPGGYQPVTYEFENADQLTAEILGPEPCKTLITSGQR